MSFCRWSSDDWKSDVYCYESDEGFVTHVASNRVVGDVPPELDIMAVPVEEWAARHKEAMDFLETAERRPIGLPEDGKTFLDADADGMLATLMRLRWLGYHVPQDAIEELREEASEPAPGGDR